MNDLPPLWQIIPVAVLVVWGAVWLVKRVTSSRGTGPGHQNYTGVPTSFDSSSESSSSAALPGSATAIRKALAKGLRLPLESISADTVRAQLASYGVSQESSQIVEQILREAEAKQQGRPAPPAADIEMMDMLKMAQELKERLP